MARPSAIVRRFPKSPKRRKANGNLRCIISRKETPLSEFMKMRRFGLAAIAVLLTLPCYGYNYAGSTSKPTPPGSLPGGSQPQTTENHQAPDGRKGSGGPQANPPLTQQEQANQLSDQVQKLMVRCANMLASRDPLSLETCKQQRDLADQYPGRRLMVDRILAHDEYGIALAVFDKKQDALAEFSEEIRLLPVALKPGAVAWSTAYWHRAMIYSQLNDFRHADLDYRAAESSFRREQRREGSRSPSARMRSVLRQHAALLQKQGKLAESQKLLREASK